MSRRSDRRGRATSVAGDPAAQALSDLVAQFADPFAFARELVQNSLDADASCIEIELRWADGTLSIAVIDDGEGMDRATIEGYLLTLFRSTKEDDLTKIGKFGVGFVSLFALQPREVVVDTGRDGVWHRVVFAQDRSWTLVRRDEPFEGTTVTLQLDVSRKRAGDYARAVRDSAKRWCRYAEAEISTSATGVRGGWPSTSIAEPFGVESPVSVELHEDGLHAVLGISAQVPPKVGFYNQGLTLWEGAQALIPGVCFRVVGRHLEHTLTRDNVRQDRHYRHVIQRLEREASGPLCAAVHDALRRHAVNDPDQLAPIYAALLGSSPPWSWAPDAAIVPQVGGAPLCLRELRPSVWQRFSGPEPLLFGPDAPPERAIAASGQQLLRADSADHPMLRWISDQTGRPLRRATELFYVLCPAQLPPACQATLEAADALAQRLALGLHLLPAILPQRETDFAVAAASRYPVQPLDALQQGSFIHVGIHPLVEQLASLPLALGAPLLLRAAQLSAGQAGPLPLALPQALHDALEREA